MSTLYFPADSFSECSLGVVEEFDFTAMVLVAFNRYCRQLILFEIFDLEFCRKKTYEYRFNSREIASLAQKEPNFFRRKKDYRIKYDFTMNCLQKRYSGEILLAVKFVNKNTLENSFYSITIEVLPDNDLKIYPYFLTQSGVISLLGEFFQRLWMPVFMELENLNPPKSVVLHDYRLSSVFLVEDKRLEFVKENREFVEDVLFLAVSIVEKYAPKHGYAEISTDDILALRGLAKNKNSIGVENGYKRKERYKVHYAFQVLNALGLLIVREVSEFNYIVKTGCELLEKMPVSVCRYSYRNALWEKRFSAFLYKSKKRVVRLKDLYSLIADVSTSLKPLQVRDKFETVMDNLVFDGVLVDWHYLSIDEEELINKKWFSKWCDLKIVCRYCH